jgi:predicted glycosyltransferase
MVCPRRWPTISVVTPTGSRSEVGRHGPRVLAYSHDGYGLGHLRRNLRIVCGLKRYRADVDALLVTGAKAVGSVVSGSGVDWLRLPAVIKVANGCYAPDEGNEAGHHRIDVLRRRADMIADAVRTFRPDLVLVDRYPRGMHDELTPAFEILQREHPEVPAVLGLRDILDRRETVWDEWQRARHSEAIRELYRSVLVYGDRSVFDAVEEYQLPDDIAAKTTFTGYLGDDVTAPSARQIRNRHRRPGRRLAVCTLGGGRDAYPVADTFLSAMGRLSRHGWDGLLVTGPYMSLDDVAKLRVHPMANRIPILEIVRDVPSHLGAADVAVCMGGYNTMCEVLALAVPAVAIPRIKPREEQLMRCERFAERGLLSVLRPDELRPGPLADAVVAVAEVSNPARLAPFRDIAHSGIETTATELASFLPVPVGER